MLEYEKQEKIEHNFLFGVSFIDTFIILGWEIQLTVMLLIVQWVEVTQTSWRKSTYSVPI